MPVLITETVRDDEYQRYLAANGYASKTATRPTFHSVKAGLAFDICKNVKGTNTTTYHFSTTADRFQNKSAFVGTAVVVWATVVWSILMLCGLRLI